MANPFNPASKSSLLWPANPCTLLDNSKITWICKVELQGFAGGANRICQLDYKDLPTGATKICQLDGTFFAPYRLKGFKMKIKGNIRKSESLNPEQVYLNMKS